MLMGPPPSGPGKGR